jgi:hypothetical protein
MCSHVVLLHDVVTREACTINCCRTAACSTGLKLQCSLTLCCDRQHIVNVIQEGVVRRDEAVWRACRAAGVPIVHLLAGGYTKPLSAETVTASLVNLHLKELMPAPADTAAGTSSGDGNSTNDAATTAANQS